MFVYAFKKGTVHLVQDAQLLRHIESLGVWQPLITQCCGNATEGDIGIFLFQPIFQV